MPILPLLVFCKNYIFHDLASANHDVRHGSNGHFMANSEKCKRYESKIGKLCESSEAKQCSNSQKQFLENK